MPINTKLSYALRIVTVIQITFLILGLVGPLSRWKGPEWLNRPYLVAMLAVTCGIPALLIADLATRSDQSRKWAKSLDVVVVITWMLLMVVLGFRSVPVIG